MIAAEVPYRPFENEWGARYCVQDVAVLGGRCNEPLGDLAIDVGECVRCFVDVVERCCVGHDLGRRMPSGPDEAVLDVRDRIERLLGDELRAGRAEADNCDVPDRRTVTTRHELSVTTEPLAGSHRP